MTGTAARAGSRAASRCRTAPATPRAAKRQQHEEVGAAVDHAARSRRCPARQPAPSAISRAAVGRGGCPTGSTTYGAARAGEHEQRDEPDHDQQQRGVVVVPEHGARPPGLSTIDGLRGVAQVDDHEARRAPGAARPRWSEVERRRPRSGPRRRATNRVSARARPGDPPSATATTTAATATTSAGCQVRVASAAQTPAAEPAAPAGQDQSGEQEDQHRGLLPGAARGQLDEPLEGQEDRRREQAGGPRSRTRRGPARTRSAQHSAESTRKSRRAESTGSTPTRSPEPDRQARAPRRRAGRRC